MSPADNRKDKEKDMAIRLDAMSDGKKKRVYEMWANTSFDNDGVVQNTPCRGGISKDSYTFRANGKNACDTLADVFGLQPNAQTFKEKFCQACCGNGQEESRITRLHSSALCALLFFYNVTENNRLTLTLDGREVAFDRSYFEYKNTVIKGRKPSSVDVVLTGKDKSGKSVVLFLESKFAEYYYSSKCKHTGISTQYLHNEYSKPLYDGVIKGMGIRIEDGGSEYFSLVSNESVYLEGIKQMISHYVGVRNLLCGKVCDESPAHQAVSKAIIDNEADVILGEIVFDRCIGDLKLGRGRTADKTALESYEELFTRLAEAMNEQLKRENITRFTVCKVLLKYSALLDAPRIDSKVKEFYCRH